MRKPHPFASIYQNAPIAIDFCQVHRWALHLRIRQSKLRMNVVNAFQKISEISSCGFNRCIIPKNLPDWNRSKYFIEIKLMQFNVNLQKLK